MKAGVLIFSLLLYLPATGNAQTFDLVEEIDGFHHLPSSVFFPFHDSFELIPVKFPYLTIYYSGPEARMRYSHKRVPLQLLVHVYRASRDLEQEFRYLAGDFDPMHEGTPETIMLPCEQPGLRGRFMEKPAYRKNEKFPITVLTLYRRAGWFVSLQLDCTHDTEPQALRLLAELTGAISPPEPVRTLPVAYEPSSGSFLYAGDVYRSPFWADYLPLLRDVRNRENLPEDTVREIIRYEARALESRRSLLWAPLFVDVIPLACLAWIEFIEPSDGPHESDTAGEIIAGLSSGSKAVLAVGTASLVFGLTLIVNSIRQNPGLPYPLIGRINGDLMEP